MKDQMEINTGSYPVYIGIELFAKIDEFISHQPRKISKVFILSDENTAKYCLSDLFLEVDSLKNAEILEIKSGEVNKTLDACKKVWKHLVDQNAERSAMLINLGGGVVCDMGGFAASTYKRGIRYINIPTTLMSQVDAAVGGKVGVDLNNIKNQIGLFNAPLAVFVNPLFLKTLPMNQLLSGFAEVIKHALIGNASFWEYLQHNRIEKLLSFPFDHEIWHNIIAESIRIKNSIVIEDPFEEGLRKKLNFGHTIGHAIESFSLSVQRDSLLHGEAIAIGLICETFLSYRYAYLSQKKLKEISDFISSNYPHYKINIEDYEQILAFLDHDKKNAGGQQHYTLISAIGRAITDQHCEKDVVIMALDFYRNLK